MGRHVLHSCGSEFYVMCCKDFGFCKNYIIFLLAKWLFASEEGLWSLYVVLCCKNFHKFWRQCMFLWRQISVLVEWDPELFLISNFRRVLNVMCFFLGNSLVSEFYIYIKFRHGNYPERKHTSRPRTCTVHAKHRQFGEEIYVESC